MLNNFFAGVLVVFVVSCTSKPIPRNAPDRPVTGSVQITEPVLTVGEVPVSEPELLETFADFAFSDSSEYHSAIQNYLKKKRLYLEALERGYGKNDSHLEEIESYTKLIAKSYIITPEAEEDLTRLTYERLKWEINASHILIAVSPYAPPSDTLKAYQAAEKLRSDILQGASFDSLATMYSADINTRESGGSMGWFSALQLIFPLENAAYNLNVNGVSDVVRTSAGFHLIKVNGKRPYSGQVRVKHILKAVSIEDSEDVAAFQKQQIDSLYNLIKAGTDFDRVCEENSDDIYSRTNGGLLDPFGVGTRLESNFEQVAFSLKEGEVSEPIRSQVGWHIIKLIEKLPLGSYDDLKDMIFQKVTTDSRGEYLKTQGIQKLLGNVAPTINQGVWSSVLLQADQRILERKWDIDRTKVTGKTLISLGEEKYTDEDFLVFAKNKQLFEQQPQNYTPDMFFRWYLSDYILDIKQNYILKNLASWKPEYGLLSQLFREDVISTNFLNDQVIERSVSDTLGQRLFYEAHISNYQWPKKATATLIKANKKSLIEAYYEIVAGGLPYRLKRGILPIYFRKEISDLDESQKRTLAGLLQILGQNKSYIVEIGGHSDVNEDPGVSSKRISEVVNYLRENGLPITRIREYDYGTSRLADRFDWAQNQRITFQFFSNDKRDIAGILTDEKDSLTVARGNYFEGSNPLIDGTSWEPGDFEAEFEGNFYRIEIEKIIPASAKTLKEARGSVIKDYQKELEKQLLEELTVKYPVSFDEDKLKTIFNQLKDKN